MVQNAIVKEVVREGVARVSLLREMECGMHCDGACAGCTQKPTEEILVLAENGIGAKKGDFVEVEPTGVGNISVSFIVFLLPCVGLALGYMFAQSVLGLNEMVSLLGALVGLAVSFIPAFLINRSIARSDKPEFRILKFLLR